jgi:hypothetical protein
VNSRNGIVGAQISARSLKDQSPDESGFHNCVSVPIDYLIDPEKIS